MGPGPPGRATHGALAARAVPSDGTAASRHPQRVKDARIRSAARDVTHPGARERRGGRPRGPTLVPRITRILELQRLAGNRATTLMLQRNRSAPDPSKGERWNDGKAY